MPQRILLLCCMFISTAAWAQSPTSAPAPDSAPGSVDSGPVAEWNFDEGITLFASDSSGNGHHAELFGPSWVKQGKGYAVSFDGFDDYIHCGKSADFGFGTGGPMSIEFWIKPTRKAHGEARIFGEGYDNYAVTYYNTELCNWYIGGGSTGNWSGSNLNLNQWNHVAVAFDGEMLHMWVNSRQLSSRKSPNKDYKADGTFLIGVKDSPKSPHFKGLIDKVRIYNRALTNADAAAHFKSEMPDYIDLAMVGRFVVESFHYPDRREMVVDADYQKLLPLKGAGRLEVTIASADQPDKVIDRQFVKQVDGRSGQQMITFSCKDLADGKYLVRTKLTDDHGDYPIEEFTFDYPRPTRPLHAPCEQIVAALPPKPSPTPYGFKLDGAGFTLTVKGVDYPVRTRVSWPNGDFNTLAATVEGEATWKPTAKALGDNHYQVTAAGDHYKLDRNIHVRPTHVYIKDTYTNTTDKDLGLLIYNDIPVKADQVTKSLLSGYERRGRQAELNYPDYGPSTFFTDKNTGFGVVPIDDVFVVQGVPYVGWKGGAGVCTEKFALAPGASYTLEWAIYPTTSGKYYDFINAFRKAEGRISTVAGAPGYITYGPASRRQVPSKEFVEIRNLDIGIITCLSHSADYPELHIEGIEFTNFPKEMALIKQQTTAIHRIHPRMKVIFHIAHSLYCTNDPDQFADSKVIQADGTQPSWGDGSIFGEERFKDGWKWWIFYPTPGNSFHDAMMKSVDVMMDEMGINGGFMDGFLAGYMGQWTYDGRWDGHSAIIDTNTKTIKRKIGSVLLLSQPSMIEYARKIRDKGGVVVSLHSVLTRSIANEKYIVFANECASGPQMHLAPNILALSNHSTWNEKQLYLDMLDKLHWGELFIYYSEPTFFKGMTYPSLAAKQTPITFEQIDEGLVRGKERIITMNSGVYGWNGDRRLHLVHKFDGRGVPMPNDFNSTVDGQSVRTELKFGKNESAVIEPIAVELQAASPVNVRVLQFDDAGFLLLLNGQGDANIEMFVGARSPSASFTVVADGETTTVKEKEGILTVPIKLAGLVKVTIKRAD